VCNIASYIIIIGWKPVLRTDFLWTCWGLNRMEHHLEAMYPHIPISTITNPSPQSYLINILPHSITHYIELLSNPFVLPRCDNSLPVPYLIIYHSPDPLTKAQQKWVNLSLSDKWSKKIAFESRNNLHMIPRLWVVSRPDGEQLVKNTQPQCTNMKQSGVNDRTNKYRNIYIYIYDHAL
jgi:hypothetical protein